MKRSISVALMLYIQVFLVYCHGEKPISNIHAENEIVMNEGMQISVTNSTGTLIITAGKNYERSFTWEGATRSLTMWPRTERWNGSYGLYYPGPGNHWEEHNMITRAVVEEGYKYFDSTQDALAWLNKVKLSSLDYIYTSTGLAVGWSKSIKPNGGDGGVLHVNIWQIYINGLRPANLPASDNDKITVQMLK